MNPRALALQILTKITQEKAYSHLAMKQLPTNISDQDKALVTQIVYGTMQNYMYVRHLWMQYVETTVKKPAIALILDMSVFQLMFLNRIPSYAIVNEAVDLAKPYGKANASFVNGVLQSFLRGPKTISPSITDEIEVLSLTTSHPLWLVKMWVKHYGLDHTKQICAINNVPPRNVARVNTLKTSKASLLAQYHCEAGKLSEDALIFQEPIASTAAFQLGEVAIQDEGSQMVAFIVDPKPNDRVLDVCAAPGSKTIHMAARMQNTGQIIAHELHEHRCELIRESCMRYGATNIEVKCVDSTTSASLYPPGSFTHVLVDAPCSGLGVMRRKPDIKLLARQDELDGILSIQAQHLDAVKDLVGNGGVLVYSTCTLNKKENEKQVEAFLSANPQYELVHEQTILPHIHDCDGFYIAKMVRNKK